MVDSRIRLEIAVPSGTEGVDERGFLPRFTTQRQTPAGHGATRMTGPTTIAPELAAPRRIPTSPADFDALVAARFAELGVTQIDDAPDATAFSAGELVEFVQRVGGHHEPERDSAGDDGFDPLVPTWHCAAWCGDINTAATHEVWPCPTARLIATCRPVALLASLAERQATEGDAGRDIEPYFAEFRRRGVEMMTADARAACPHGTVRGGQIAGGVWERVDGVGMVNVTSWPDAFRKRMTCLVCGEIRETKDGCDFLGGSKR